jgi:hypothetical protein
MFTPEEVLEQVRTLRARIPDFVQLPNDRTTRNMRRKSRLNPEFAHGAFGAVGASEMVQSAIGNTPEELLQAEDDLVFTVPEKLDVFALHVRIASYTRQSGANRGPDVT